MPQTLLRMPCPERRTEQLDIRLLATNVKRLRIALQRGHAFEDEVGTTREYEGSWFTTRTRE